VTALTDFKRLAVIIGGFPRGHLSRTTLQLADRSIRVDTEMLDSWIISGRIIYEYEIALNLPEKRLQKERIKYLY
jgi:rRNA pseudouridine-1189 N-methylase Emg1 (Nep1/Mra1 family)